MRDTICGHVAKEGKLGSVFWKPKGCLKQDSRKALVQPDQPVLLNVNKYIIPLIARGGYVGAGSLLGTIFLNVTQLTTLSS